MQDPLDPDSFSPPPEYPHSEEGFIPPPPRHVENYLPPDDQESVEGAQSEVYQDYQGYQGYQGYPGYPSYQGYEGDPNATSFGPGGYQPQDAQLEEQPYVRPQYNVHPMLRREESGSGYRPYKRKASSPTHPSSSSSSSSFTPADFTPADTDDDIRPNLSLYQQNKPQPYVPKARQQVLPSREEESVGSYNYKSNPFEQQQTSYQPTSYQPMPKPSPAPAGGRGSGGIGPRGPGAGMGRGAEVLRSADGVAGVAAFKRRTFTVEESRDKLKTKQQQQESAVSITNSVVASIREKLASGGRISKGQAKVLDRDQEIISTIAMPTYVSHRTGSGLTPEEIQKAQDEHTRKLLGWKYHVAVKARTEQQLQTKRQKKD